jgi:hypothetical protein
MSFESKFRASSFLISSHPRTENQPRLNVTTNFTHNKYQAFISFSFDCHISATITLHEMEFFSLSTRSRSKISTTP